MSIFLFIFFPFYHGFLWAEACLFKISSSYIAFVHKQNRKTVII